MERDTFVEDLEALWIIGDSGHRWANEQQARVTGHMLSEAAQHAGHADHGLNGTHFVMIEQWDSVEQRVAFSRGASAGRSRNLFQHILPEHTHEIYEDVTPG